MPYWLVPDGREVIVEGVKVALERLGTAAVERLISAGVLRLRFRLREQLLRRGLNIIQTDGNAGSIREARLLTQLGAVERATGRFDAAGRDLRQAIRICEKNPKTTQPESAAAMFQLAEAQQGNRLEADAGYQGAIEIDRAKGRAAKYALAVHLLGYASFLARDNHAAQAETAAREALNIRTETLRDSWEVDEANSVLSFVLTAQSRYPEAERLAATACANLIRKVGPYARPSLAAGARLALVYQAQGPRPPTQLLATVKNRGNVLCCVY